VSPDDKIKAFIEILKIVAWPALLLWLVWYLRDEVKRVATRITELGLTGAKFAPPPPEQVPSRPQEGVFPTSSGSQLAPGGDRVQQFIAGVRGYLSDEQVEPAVQKVRAELISTFGANPSDQVEGLLYVVASLNIQITHERNYNAIYGSQLRLMEQMIPAVGVSADAAHKAFEEAKAAWPDAYRVFTFEQWIGFLTTTGLVSTEGANYVLTPYGRGFLKYIVDKRYSPNKIF
jgi:hypothetical protein